MSKTLMSDSRIRWFTAVTMVACLVLVSSHLFDQRTGAMVAKPLASSAFIGVAWLCGAIRSRYGRILLAGLGLSWFGDMFLLGTGEQFFLAGLASFLLAHVAYVVAFLTFGQNGRWILAALLPVAAVSLLATAWLAPFVPADMTVPVRTYTFFISLMLVSAFGVKGAGGPWLVPAGALLFYFSDLSVASLQFTDPAFPNYVWGLPFYYTGQLLLAMSVAYASQRTTNQ